MRLLFVLIVAQCLAACADVAAPPDDPSGGLVQDGPIDSALLARCGPDRFDPEWLPFPQRVHASFDGRYVSFVTRREGELHVVDLTTGTDRIVDPRVWQFDFPTRITRLWNAWWCPYDGSRIIIEAPAEVDTLGNGEGRVRGILLIQLDIETGYFENVTPLEFGRGPADIQIRDWVSSGDPLTDTLLTGRGFIIVSERRYQERIPGPGQASPTHVGVFRTSEGSYLYGDRPFPLPLQTDFPLKISWSRDGHLALCYGMIWKDTAVKIGLSVIDLPTMQPLSSFTFLDQCYVSAEPAFLTDSTMVIGLRRLGCAFPFLAECTFDGRVLRMLWDSK